MKKGILIWWVAMMCVQAVFAGEWQWAVTLKGIVSEETHKEPEAFLWIPEKCEHLSAVLWSQQNMTEETLFEMPSFRDSLSEMNVGLIWVAPGIDQQWDVRKGLQKVFGQMMNDLAEVSGYTELCEVPVIPFGHSAMATFPWNFAAWNPERTLAVISYHGDAPRTNLCGYGRENLEWGRTRNIDGIPGLMIEGEYEWWEARVNPALAFRMMYPESCISFLCDTGRGHFDVSEQTARYIAKFIRKSLAHRVPANGGKQLVKVNPADGWLVQRWSPDEHKKRVAPAPFSRYKGDVHDAFWYFDREMAELTEQRYKEHKLKKMQYLGIYQQGSLVEYDPQLHAGVMVKFLPEADGLTFHLGACFTDSLRRGMTNTHAEGNIRLEKICGPVEQLDDSTFTVRFYRMGMYNPRRTPDIWLLASHPGDKKYKSAVQQLNIRIPYRQTEGKRQCILFPGLEDVKVGSAPLKLKAVSDCGLPVHYYVKEGPARIQGNDVLEFTQIPPCSRFPMKVTVVAWQYGLAGKVQTAEPVERSFYIFQ